MWIVYIIIILVVVYLLAKLVSLIISFISSHKKLSLCLFLMLGIMIISLIRDESPFSLIGKIFQWIKKLLWSIVYQHTFIVTLLVFAVIIGISILLASCFLKIIKKEHFQYISSILIGVLSLIFILSNMHRNASSIVAAEAILGIVQIYSYRTKIKQRIGFIPETFSALGGIYQLNSLLFFFFLFSYSGLIIATNDWLKTTVSEFFFPMILGAILLLATKGNNNRIIQGAIYLEKEFKARGLFAVNDFIESAELSSLKDAAAYLNAVIQKAEENKKIYKLSSKPGYYISSDVEHRFQKGINANLSSTEIKNSFPKKINDALFEEVYQDQFAKFKGYSIQFDESKSKVEFRKTHYGIGAVEFILMRYPIDAHPVLKEIPEIRKQYILALNSLVTGGLLAAEEWQAKLSELETVFQVEIDDCAKNDQAISVFSKNIKRKTGFLTNRKTDYSYLLLLEGFYFKNLLSEQPLTYNEIETAFAQLKINKSYRDLIYKYIKSMFIEGDISSVEQMLASRENSSIGNSIEYVHKNIMWNEKFINSKQFHVSVCATMSAGKSTFINALLGMDYIPTRNEACTAKITTIRDNDQLTKLIGCSIKDDSSEQYSSNINGKILNEWNNDNDVREIILEGNIEEIECSSSSLEIIDTPGTNNSEDTSHHEKTIDFLKTTTIDLVVFLFNAENRSTNDSKELLKEILNTVKNHSAKIIFAINKIDAFDEEGHDSVSATVNNLCEELHDYGFNSPIVFPLSANAARLFKMAIKKAPMTKKETRDFNNLFELFSNFNASTFAKNAPSCNESIAYQHSKKDSIITIGEQTYSYNQIVDALGNTGIFSIENWIKMQMETK